MSRLILGTNAVSMDEPCFVLKELHEQSPGSRGWRRYQIIKVMRADRVAEFRRDLGPARRFKVEQFCIPGGVVDEAGRIEIVCTVGELYDAAELLRSDKYRRPDPQQTPDLVGEYREQPERRRLWRKRRSMSGPLVRIQR